MSRRINVNPAHYKVAGRERQGEDIVQVVQKHAFGQQQAVEQRWQAQHSGAPWETTPPAPLVDTPKERQRAEAAERRAAKRAAKRATAKRAKKSPTASRRATASKNARKVKKVVRARPRGSAARKVAAKRRSSRR